MTCNHINSHWLQVIFADEIKIDHAVVSEEEVQIFRDSISEINDALKMYFCTV